MNNLEQFKEDPFIDLRSIPDVSDIRAFPNSTLKISFTEIVKFLGNNNTDNAIDELLANQILQVSVISGFDESEFMFGAISGEFVPDEAN